MENFGTSGQSSDQTQNGSFQSGRSVRELGISNFGMNVDIGEALPWDMRARRAANYAVAYVSTVAELSIDKLRKVTNIVARGVVELTMSAAEKRKLKTKRWALGFGPVVISPGDTQTISVAPQCLFRADTLVNTGDSEDLFLCAAFVGQKIQMPFAYDAVSVKAFNNTPLGNNMKWDTCDPALQIMLQVKNEGKEPRMFHCALGGEAAL